MELSGFQTPNNSFKKKQTVACISNCLKMDGGGGGTEIKHDEN